MRLWLTTMVRYMAPKEMLYYYYYFQKLIIPYYFDSLVYYCSSFCRIHFILSCKEVMYFAISNDMILKHCNKIALCIIDDGILCQSKITEWRLSRIVLRQRWLFQIMMITEQHHRKSHSQCKYCFHSAHVLSDSALRINRGIRAKPFLDTAFKSTRCVSFTAIRGCAKWVGPGLTRNFFFFLKIIPK